MTQTISILVIGFFITSLVFTLRIYKQLRREIKKTHLKHLKETERALIHVSNLVNDGQQIEDYDCFIDASFLSSIPRYENRPDPPLRTKHANDNEEE
jgi:hypothetical protein